MAATEQVTLNVDGMTCAGCQVFPPSKETARAALAIAGPAAS